MSPHLTSTLGDLNREMSVDSLTIDDLSIEDDDCPPAWRKKSRTPKPRLPPSLLWQIPSDVLKQKEGRKKLSTERYNALGCRVCNKTFHKRDQLLFHMEDHHKDKASLSVSRFPKTFSPSLSRGPSRSPRENTAATRRSSRMLNRSTTYQDDEDIEVLDEMSWSSPSSRSNRAKGSRKKNAVEVVDLDDSDDDDIQEITMELDEDPPRVVQKEDEEILLLEDENVSNLKRKSYSNSGNLKKRKLDKENDVTLDEMIEVKSQSGKSLFVKKSTLSKVLPSYDQKRKVSPVERLLSLSPT